MEIQDNHPDDINIYDIDDLSKDLKAHIKDHDSYHSDIEDLVQEDEDSALLEEQERDKHHELHRDLNKALRMLRDSLSLWDECKVLVHDMDATLDETETDSPHFRTTADALLEKCSTFYYKAGTLSRNNPFLRESIQYLQDKGKLLTSSIRKTYKDTPPSSTTPASAPTTPSSSTSQGAALHIELKWQTFQTLFTTAIKTRAKGHSPLKIRGLLLKSMLHEEGKKILSNLQDDSCDLSTMMSLLRVKFGSPKIF